MHGAGPPSWPNPICMYYGMCYLDIFIEYSPLELFSGFAIVTMTVLVAKTAEFMILFGISFSDTGSVHSMSSHQIGCFLLQQNTQN